MVYGHIIPNLRIDDKPAPYGVYNERAIRATAGIMMLVGAVTFVVVFTTQQFVRVHIVAAVFWLQFAIAVVWGAQYSPFGVIGARAVANQRPEYVGAIQKRFARSLGRAMATAMLIVTRGVGMTGAVPFGICMTCLLLMRMEAALGICVGCTIYHALVHHGIMPRPPIAPACPGGVCDITDRPPTA